MASSSSSLQLTDLPKEILVEIFHRLGDLARTSAASSPPAISSAASTSSTVRAAFSNPSNAEARSGSSSRPPPRGKGQPQSTSPSPSSQAAADAGASATSAAALPSYAPAMPPPAAIPPIPNDLAASPICSLMLQGLELEYLLAPSQQDEEEEGECGSSFRLVCRPRLGKDQRYVTVFVFSSDAGIWRAATISDACPMLFAAGCVHGYVYWQTILLDRLLILDTDKMKLFWLTGLPHVPHDPHTKGVLRQAIGGSGEGSVGVVTIADRNVYLHTKAIVGGTADERWRHEKTMPLLPGYYKWRFVKPLEGDGYLVLQGTNLEVVAGMEGQYFTLDLKTFRFEKLLLSTICENGGRSKKIAARFQILKQLADDSCGARNGWHLRID
uniref:F-box domain-containing protein n=1 Tax=Leersia perrieri TaxID=77586 RepID=A0A0D9XHM2_9ORYZ